jgi:hypothetical protein
LSPPFFLRGARGFFAGARLAYRRTENGCDEAWAAQSRQTGRLRHGETCWRLRRSIEDGQQRRSECECYMRRGATSTSLLQHLRNHVGVGCPFRRQSNYYFMYVMAEKHHHAPGLVDAHSYDRSAAGADWELSLAPCDAALGMCCRASTCSGQRGVPLANSPPSLSWCLGRSMPLRV